jgi:hypothetical protein
MNSPIQYISLGITLIFLAVIFSLIVKGRLREEYAIIWIATSMVFSVFAIKPKLIDYFAGLLHVYYAPALLFLVFIFSIIILLVHLSVVNSKQHHQIKKISQEIAFLKKKLGE